MHILYLNRHLTQPDSEQGTWGRKFVGELRDRGVTVTTFPEYRKTTGIEETNSSKEQGLLSTVIKNYAPRWLQYLCIEPLAVARGLYNSLLLWHRARQLPVSPPDLIYGRVDYCDLGPWLVGRTLGRPVILEVHSPHYLERTFRGWRQSRLLQAFERFQWRQAAFVRVVSKPVIKIMEQEGVDSQRIRFIPYGVKILPQRTQIQSPGSPFLKVIFVGSFYSWHGVETLLRAFALARKDVPHAQLELIGDGLTLPSDKRLAVTLGLEDAVKFTGWLPRETMLEHLRLADIGVAPFLALEPFYFDPAKILDYMSTGISIVASRLDRIAEMLQEGRGGLLVPPGDSMALAAALCKLAYDHDFRNDLGVAAREILLEEGYASEITTKRIMALCEEAVEPNNLTNIAT